jgi:hypothetical protein
VNPEAIAEAYTTAEGFFGYPPSSMRAPNRTG